MPIQTEKLDELPIVVATYSTFIVTEDVEQMYRDTEALLSGHRGRYYRISDVRWSTTSFADFIKIFENMQQHGRFRTSDPDLRAIFVGANSWIDNYQQMSKKQLSIEIPAFPSMGDAMRYINQDMAE